jgi:hypothetical protein
MSIELVDHLFNLRNFLLQNLSELSLTYTIPSENKYSALVGMVINRTQIRTSQKLFTYRISAVVASA